MTINKEQFCKIINDLEQNEKFVDELNKLFRHYRTDETICATGLENTVVQILEAIFKDEENQWISWWLWECDFGKSYKEGDVTEEDGTNIPLGTAGELYDFLIKEMKECSS